MYLPDPCVEMFWTCVFVLLQQLSPTASIQDTQKWLLKNRFNSYTRLFSNFSGTHTHYHTITHVWSDNSCIRINSSSVLFAQVQIC